MWERSEVYRNPDFTKRSGRAEDRSGPRHRGAAEEP
jgi:hypothetical protein